MDKQRLDFEAWKLERGEDVDPWSAWQASRAGIAIELPPRDVWAQITDREGCARNQAIDECKASIESAGLKVI
jgi:hypothetical protein